MIYEYLYTFYTDYIEVISIANPEEPCLINKVEIQEIYIALSTSMTLYGDYIYYANNSGVYVFSIEERENPRYINRYRDFLHDYPLSLGRITADDEYVYVAGFYGALRIYEKNDDGTLRLCLLEESVGGYRGVYGIAVQDDYCFMSVGDRVIVADLGDRREISIVGGVDVPGANRFRMFGDYLFIYCDEGFTMISIEDPEHPHIIGSYDPPGQPVDFAANMEDGILAVAQSGIGIYDINEAMDINEEHIELLPSQFNLSVFPNPFNSRTRINFRIPDEGTAYFEVFDMNGREVFSSPNQALEAGEHTVEWNAEDFPSGAYLIKLHNGLQSRQTKVHLIK